MRTLLSLLSLLIGISAVTPSFAAEREWTFLIFLNGKNNLDRYGFLNLNQIEKIGSNNKVSVVVQWGSLENEKTQRLYMQKDADPDRVTSPVLEDMGQVDMGDPAKLVEFVKWGMEKYPAKKYFVGLWNHGSGWHPLPADGPLASSNFLRPFDISWDDLTGNSISTLELGEAMAEIAEARGKKIEILGADACLMAMAEVAHQIRDSVEVMIGSEEVEPAQGWPYDQLMEKWVADPEVSPAALSTILTEEYVKAYSGGQYGDEEVQLSSLDLSMLPALTAAVSSLGSAMRGLDTSTREQVRIQMQNIQTFLYSDYGDVVDFADQVGSLGIASLKKPIAELRESAGRLVISNQATPDYNRAHGVAMWLPSFEHQVTPHLDSYRTLSFHTETGWGDFIGSLFVSPARGSR